MNRCVLQSDSITITGTQQSCCFILLDHFEVLELVLFYPFFFLTFLFFCENYMKSQWLHHIPVSVLYYKCQAGNLKFIKDTSQSQDVKIGLSNRHEPQKAMSCSFKESNIHNSGREILELSVSGLNLCAAIAEVRQQSSEQCKEGYSDENRYWIKLWDACILIMVCSLDSCLFFFFSSLKKDSGIIETIEKGI